MLTSILDSTKKVLNIDPEDPSFDEDIVMHINSVFVDLHQLGVGPEVGFMIEDKDDEWDTYLGGDPLLNNVKTYMFLRIRLIFDPPQSPHGISAMKEQKDEMEQRIVWAADEAREAVVL